jgi:hypothetical protein
MKVFNASPSAGAIIGGTYGLLRMCTSIFYKSLNIRPDDNEILYTIRTAIDIALTNLIASYICLQYGVSIALMDVAILIPSIFVTTLLGVGGYYLFVEKIVEIVNACVPHIRGLMLAELDSYIHY